MEITVTDLVSFLGSVPGFRDLPISDVEQNIVPIIGISHFEAGQSIINLGDTPHTLFIIYKGRVHGVYESEDKKEHHFFIHEGNIFGESAIVSSSRRSSVITASTATTCLTLDIDTFQHIMMRDWRFTKAFFILIGQRAIEKLVKTDIEPYYWSDKLKLGIPEIDDQHQRLFDLFNDLGAFLNSVDGENNIPLRIQSFIVEILNYVDKHLKDEELLMEQSNAPWLDTHKQVHQILIDNAISFRDRISELQNIDEQIHILEQMHKVLAEWLVNHIMEEDYKFGEFYKRNYVTDSALS
ncbi:MAG: bacteriohemerythrin [Magnetococcales bacterium]|nr:bacteriohemerythrin [Magnetococcales bacterium]